MNQGRFAVGRSGGSSARRPVITRTRRLPVVERFEIRHDITYLTSGELKSRHHRMNSLEQRSLQVCNRILETQCAKWRSIRRRALTDFADGVTLRAIFADEYQTSSFRGQRFCEGGLSCAQQNCAPDKKWPSGPDDSCPHPVFLWAARRHRSVDTVARPARARRAAASRNWPPTWRCQRASQKPSRPASYATTMRLIWRPAWPASFRQRCNSFNSAASSAASLLRGWRSTPGTTPATSHFARLISITAMIVLSCSRAVRDLLASKACDMGRSIGLLQSAKGALPSPPAP